MSPFINFTSQADILNSYHQDNDREKWNVLEVLQMFQTEKLVVGLECNQEKPAGCLLEKHTGYVHYQSARSGPLLPTQTPNFVSRPIWIRSPWTRIFRNPGNQSISLLR